MNDSITTSVLQLTAALVDKPSQAVHDSPTAVLTEIANWLQARNIPPGLITDAARNLIAVSYSISTDKPGMNVCLNACVDTASFGDSNSWMTPPGKAVLTGNRMFGRGVADSKVGVSIFCHLLEMAHSGGLPLKRGTLSVLFDAGEHTGQFTGIKEFLNTTTRLPDIVAIGYPGSEAICIGARGFMRVRIKITGVSGHSGSRVKTGDNAISKAARLIERLEAAPMPTEADPHFAFGPRMTVTEIHGGGDFSVVPDSVAIGMDIRLTPSFQQETAQAWLEEVLFNCGSYESHRLFSVQLMDSWPAYRIPEDHVFAAALQTAARRVLNRNVPMRVCGPSNIGNLLARSGIPAICGFGVTCGGVHAGNEYIEVASIVPTIEIYRQALLELMG